MANFSGLAITAAGKAAIAALASGTGESLTFTTVEATDTQYQASGLEALTALENPRQSALVSSISDDGEGSVTISAALSNEELTAGYYIRTIGLFARAGGEEFLFAAAAEQSGGCYLPPFGGKTKSGVIINLTVAVGSAENIFIEAGSAGAATLQDLQLLEERITADIEQMKSETIAEIEAMSPKPYAFSVGTALWAQISEPVAGCSYSAEISAEEVAASDFPEIFFDEASLEEAGNAAVIAASGEGKIIFYARQTPSSTLSGSYFIKKGAAA